MGADAAGGRAKSAPCVPWDDFCVLSRLSENPAVFPAACIRTTTALRGMRISSQVWRDVCAAVKWRKHHAFARHGRRHYRVGRSHADGGNMITLHRCGRAHGGEGKKAFAPIFCIPLFAPFGGARVSIELSRFNRSIFGGVSGGSPLFNDLLHNCTVFRISSDSPAQ